MPTDPPSEREAAALERAHLLLAKRRQAEEQRSRLIPMLTIAALALAGLALSAVFVRDTDRPGQGVSTSACTSNDSACLGARILGQIQGPCTRAIEARLQHSPEWIDSAWERRFNSPAWHTPPNQLIFFGKQVKVRNALGAELSPSYFCVVTLDGLVVSADLRDLPRE